jgi:hypothetical protein
VLLQLAFRASIQVHTKYKQYISSRFDMCSIANGSATATNASSCSTANILHHTTRQRCDTATCLDGTITASTQQCVSCIMHSFTKYANTLCNSPCKQYALHSSALKTPSVGTPNSCFSFQFRSKVTLPKAQFTFHHIIIQQAQCGTFSKAWSAGSNSPKRRLCAALLCCKDSAACAVV